MNSYVCGVNLALFMKPPECIICSHSCTQTEPKIRISLYKLRQTWNPFIVKKKLAAIDKHVHALDPNWPVTATDVVAPTSPTIHVNPEFLLVSIYIHVLIHTHKQYRHGL